MKKTIKKKNITTNCKKNGQKKDKKKKLKFQHILLRC